MTFELGPASWSIFEGVAFDPGPELIQGEGWWAQPTTPATPDIPAVGRSKLPQALRRSTPLLVVTDGDATLFEEEVIDELAVAAGAGSEVQAITARAMAGELGFSESLRRRVGLLQGLDANALNHVRARLTLRPGVQRLISWTHSVGGRFGLVSGGFSQVLRPLMAELGIDFLAANDLEIVRGVLTGRVVGEIVDSSAKAETMHRWATLTAGAVDPSLTSEEAVGRTVAVGDGANDIPMLRQAGLGVASCAKPQVYLEVPSFLKIPRLDAVVGMLGHDPS